MKIILTYISRWPLWYKLIHSMTIVCHSPDTWKRQQECIKSSIDIKFKIAWIKFLVCIWLMFLTLRSLSSFQSKITTMLFCQNLEGLKAVSFCIITTKDYEQRGYLKLYWVWSFFLTDLSPTFLAWRFRWSHEELAMASLYLEENEENSRNPLQSNSMISTLHEVMTCIFNTIYAW